MIALLQYSVAKRPVDAVLTAIVTAWKITLLFNRDMGWLKLVSKKSGSKLQSCCLVSHVYAEISNWSVLNSSFSQFSFVRKYKLLSLFTKRCNIWEHLANDGGTIFWSRFRATMHQSVPCIHSTLCCYVWHTTENPVPEWRSFECTCCLHKNDPFEFCYLGQMLSWQYWSLPNNYAMKQKWCDYGAYDPPGPHRASTFYIDIADAVLFLNDSLACINKGCNCVWIFNRTLIAYRAESQNHFIVPGHQIDAPCSALNGRAVCCNGFNPVSDLKCISELSCCCFCVHSQLDHIFWDLDLTNQCIYTYM